MVWQTMKQSIRNGLDHEGVLPGPLKLQRKAATYYIKAKGYRASLQSRGLVYAYALAVSERECFGWHHRYSSYLWRLWCIASRTLPHVYFS